MTEILIVIDRDVASDVVRFSLRTSTVENWGILSKSLSNRFLLLLLLFHELRLAVRSFLELVAGGLRCDICPRVTDGYQNQEQREWQYLCCGVYRSRRGLSTLVGGVGAPQSMAQVLGQEPSVTCEWLRACGLRRLCPTFTQLCPELWEESKKRRRPEDAISGEIRAELRLRETLVPAPHVKQVLNGNGTVKCECQLRGSALREAREARDSPADATTAKRGQNKCGLHRVSKKLVPSAKIFRIKGRSMILQEPAKPIFMQHHDMEI